MKEFEFLEERSKQIKQEIKERKEWRKLLEKEYNLQRTWKYNLQDSVRKQWSIANKMIEHYENILKEHEEMIKELKEIK